MTEREIKMYPYGPVREFGFCEFGWYAIVGVERVRSYYKIGGVRGRRVAPLIRARRKRWYIMPKLVKRYQRGMLWMRAV